MSDSHLIDHVAAYYVAEPANDLKGNAEGPEYWDKAFAELVG